MLYLFFQTWVWILLAFILGLIIGWWLCCRCKCKDSDSVNTVVSPSPAVKTTAAAATAVSATPVSESVDVNDAWKPQGFSTAPPDVDDLKRISGVGPVIEKTLNGLGVYQFSQIAEFSRDNVSWVDNYLSFPGRIDREDWLKQAKLLADGQQTDFSKRVDKGDVEY